MISCDCYVNFLYCMFCNVCSRAMRWFCQEEETEALLTADFEIGHFFRESIIPRAVLYFTGEALEDDDDDDDVNVYILFYISTWNGLIIIIIKLLQRHNAVASEALDFSSSGF